MEQVLSDNLVIAIDAMGGDNSPRVVIEGLVEASHKNPDVRFLLFGDERQCYIEKDKKTGNTTENQ